MGNGRSLGLGSSPPEPEGAELMEGAAAVGRLRIHALATVFIPSSSHDSARFLRRRRRPSACV